LSGKCQGISECLESGHPVNLCLERSVLFSGSPCLLTYVYFWTTLYVDLHVFCAVTGYRMPLLVTSSHINVLTTPPNILSLYVYSVTHTHVNNNYQ